ncbi:hypothetical protein K438DRAFT_1866305 [Mycena galopus ATCC 62051]|nr:hypothetical protein K438DRAFT_1866305 [Mycena galopus ATCC 62051]
MAITTTVASPIKSEPRRPPRHRRRPPNGADTKSDSATLANTMRKLSTTQNAALLVLTLPRAVPPTTPWRGLGGFLNGRYMRRHWPRCSRCSRRSVPQQGCNYQFEVRFSCKVARARLRRGILLACSLMPGLALVATLILGVTSDAAPRPECEGALPSILSSHRTLLPAFLLGRMLWSLRSFFQASFAGVIVRPGMQTKPRASQGGCAYVEGGARCSWTEFRDRWHAGVCAPSTRNRCGGASSAVHSSQAWRYPWLPDLVSISG